MIETAIRSFWLIGLLNNAPWVLMLASATSISSGGVALVFLSNQIPGLLVKVTAPYWFHNVSYKMRMLMASISMSLACILVGYGNSEAGEDGKDENTGLVLELIGVAFMSFQCSLGEASSLALAGKFDSVILPRSKTLTYSALPQRQTPTSSNLNPATKGKMSSEEEYQKRDDYADNEEGTDDAAQRKEQKQTNQCITAFASGTGLAGIVGYGYKSLLSDLFGWGLSSVVFSVILFAVSYYSIFYYGLYKVEQEESSDLVQTSGRGGNIAQYNIAPIHMMESSLLTTMKQPRLDETNAVEMVSHNGKNTSHTTDSTAIQLEHIQLTFRERFKLVLSLWPYTIPLFTVYAAEYMLQAGVWSAIGFPVTSSSARAQFYHYSNWSYQVGVFISRSSGNLFSAPLSVLWLMPMLQVVNLIFFWTNAIHHFWYNYWLLLLSFFAGLLGGGVYVQAFSRLNIDFPVELREFAIASAGIADSFGILIADIASLFIQVSLLWLCFSLVLLSLNEGTTPELYIRTKRNRRSSCKLSQDMNRAIAQTQYGASGLSCTKLSKTKL